MHLKKFFACALSNYDVISAKFSQVQPGFLVLNRVGSRIPRSTPPPHPLDKQWFWEGKM